MSHRIRWLVVAASAVAATPPSAIGQAPMPAPVIAPFGEIRTRAEWDRPGGGAKADVFTLLRSRLGVRIEPTVNTRIVLQLQDSRVLGTTPSTTTTGTDVIDLHQGYLELTSRGATLVRSLRAGRQEISLGNERLVGPVNWSNTGRSFDGVRVSWTPAASEGGWNATAFAAVVEERGRHFGSPSPTAGSPDHGVIGFFGSRRIAPNATWDATLLFDAAASYRAFTDSRRATIDAHVRSQSVSSLPIGVELEGALQVGRQHFVPAAPSPSVPQTVQAWLVGARVGRFAQEGRRTTFAFGADVLSGDATPNNATYSAFATMYATNHPWYGTMDLIGDPATSTRERGLVDVLATSAFPIYAVPFKGELHRFLLDAGAGRPLGWELDASVPMVIFDAGRFEIGYSVFTAEAGAAAVGLAAKGATKHWSFLQLALPFQ